MFVIIKRYLANCNIHGIRYLVEDGFHWTERLFWFITCGLCWYGCALMIKDSLDSFYNRPVAFNTETTYLNWQTGFPSISVCMQPHHVSLDTAAALYKKNFGADILPNTFGWLFSNTIAKAKSEVRDAFNKLTSEDIIKLYRESILTCTSLMDTCYWRFEKFDCCDEFKPLRTGHGLCYVFNSKYTSADSSSGRNKYLMNQTTGIGDLTVGFTDLAFRQNTSMVLVYIHNNLELPTSVEKSDREIMLTAGKVSSVYFTVSDTSNDPNLRYVPPERRGCRFSSETENYNIYQYYSNDGCSIQLHMDNMLNRCGCIGHLFPYKVESLVCNYTGLLCIQKHSESLMAKDDMDKYCLSDCEDLIVTSYQNGKLTGHESSLFKLPQGLFFRLLQLPLIRNRRYVLRTMFDLVVGSAAGLFVGAGILSLVEMPYWLLLRLYS